MAVSLSLATSIIATPAIAGASLTQPTSQTSQAAKLASPQTAATLLSTGTSSVRRDSIQGYFSFGTNTCGWVTCTFYFTRSATNWWNWLMNGTFSGTKAAVFAAALGLACSAIGSPIAGAICAGAGGIGVSFFQDTITDAANNRQCMFARYVSSVYGPVIVWLGRTGGKWCR